MSTFPISTRAKGANVIASELEKPDLDNRSYRVIRLSNKLEALIAHDPDTDKASAALDVHVGNFSDRDDLQGQAHAVEHLLFMGTEKYPKENDYSEYLSEHSGNSNAYTASTSTNYYFEVGHEHLEGALDRFAQFFIAPLFLEETLDRELKAVDSENKKNLQNDTWRLYQLSKSLSNPKHPFCHFSTGNLQTLKELPAKRGVSVREEFLKFHDQYYSANTMKLVVLGREDLDTLQKWVETMFSDVKNKDIPDPRFEGQPFGEEQLMTQIFAKPVMDSRSVELTFPFMDEDEHYKTHPSRYAAHLIGHEGPGSLLAYLKKKGWANSLSSGPTPVATGSAFFHINIKLTEEGLGHYEDIVTAVFHYINLVKDEPVHEWILKELQSVAAVDFKFREKSPASKFTSRFAATMQRPLPREWLLSGTSLIREFDPELISKSLEFLRPDNFRVTIISRECPKGEFDQVEYWYKTDYKVEKIPESFMAKLKATEGKGKGVGEQLKGELFLPHVNEFIPTNFTVERKEVDKKQLAPSLIKNNGQARIWHKKDDTFWVPKGNVFMCLRNPIVYATPANSITARVYCDLVKDALSEYAYDAEVAGLEYSVAVSSVGIEVELSGYNDKMSVLLEKVLQKMKDLEINEDRFKVIKERNLRAYRNWIYQQPYHQVGEYTRYLNTQLVWMHSDILPELEELTSDDVRNLQPKLFRTMHVEALVHGNLYKEDALKFVDMAESILKPKALPLTQFTTRRSVLPPRGARHVWVQPLLDEKNVNSVIEYTLFVGEQTDRKLKNMLTVFAQLTEEPCFDQLRTKEQLGYIVFSGYRYGATSMSYRVIVQSERSAPYLESRIEDFLQNFKQKLNGYTDKEFQGHVKAVILRITERLKNLNQESNRLWNRIGNEVYDFEQNDADVEVLKTIKKEEIVEFYAKYIDPASAFRSKASIQMPAASKPAAPTPEEKNSQFVKTFLEFITTAGITSDEKEVGTVLANANLDKPEEVISSVKEFLQTKGLAGPALAKIMETGSAALTGAIAASKPEPALNAEDFGVLIEDPLHWKAACAISVAAQPIKPIVEFQDSTCKL